MTKLLRWTTIGLAGLVGLWFLGALALVYSPAPTFSQPAIEATAPRPAPTTCQPNITTRCWLMRDGTLLASQWLEANSATTVVLLHGVMSSSAELTTTAAMLRQTIGANVMNVDLRGHGRSGGRAGDIDYIGQYEADVADLIAALRQAQPRGRIILAGHSMGGGIVLRYAAQGHSPTVDGYLLFAPHLGSNAPTSQPRAGAETLNEPTVKVHWGRTIGLIMLNTLGMTALNNLETLYFNVAENSPIQRYSFRAMVSAAPDDYQAALTADAVPMLVVVGKDDEAFQAELYPDVIRLHPNSQTVITENEGHSGIIQSPAAFEAIRIWSASLATPPAR